MRHHPSSLIVALTAALLLASACGKDDPLPSQITPNVRRDMGPADMGVDLGPEDMGPADMGADLGPEDMGPADMGADLGPEDMGADLGPEDMGGGADLDVVPVCPSGLSRGAEHKDLAYATGDPRQVLDLYLPGNTTAPVPVLLWIHGGGWQVGSKDDVPNIIGSFVERGYAVASVEHRLSDAPWPAPIHDVKAAVRWLRGNAGTYNLDTTKFAAAGESSGGYMALMLGTSHGVPELEDLSMGHPAESSRVQAVLDLYGPVLLNRLDADATANGCSAGNALCHTCEGSPEDRLLDCPGDLNTCSIDLLAQASPITHVDAQDPPTLIIHGTDDCVVATPQSQRMFEALDAEGVPVELVKVLGAGHGVGEVVTPETVLSIRGFLESTLRQCRPADATTIDTEECLAIRCNAAWTACAADDACRALDQCVRACYGQIGCFSTCTQGVPQATVDLHNPAYTCGNAQACYDAL